MSNDPKRALVAIHATGVADFRAQLAAAIAEAQRVNDVPVLPAEGAASEAALVSALADIDFEASLFAVA